MVVVGFKVEERLARSLTRGTSRDIISRVRDLPIIVTYKRTLVTQAGKQKAKFFFNSQKSQRYQLKCQHDRNSCFICPEVGIESVNGVRNRNSDCSHERNFDEFQLLRGRFTVASFRVDY